MVKNNSSTKQLQQDMSNTADDLANDMKTDRYQNGESTMNEDLIINGKILNNNNDELNEEEDDTSNNLINNYDDEQNMKEYRIRNRCLLCYKLLKDWKGAKLTDFYNLNTARSNARNLLINNINLVKDNNNNNNNSKRIKLSENRKQPDQISDLIKRTITNSSSFISIEKHSNNNNNSKICQSCLDHLNMIDYHARHVNKLRKIMNSKLNKSFKLIQSNSKFANSYSSLAIRKRNKHLLTNKFKPNNNKNLTSVNKLNSNRHSNNNNNNNNGNLNKNKLNLILNNNNNNNSNNNKNNSRITKVRQFNSNTNITTVVNNNNKQVQKLQNGKVNNQSKIDINNNHQEDQNSNNITNNNLLESLLASNNLINSAAPLMTNQQALVLLAAALSMNKNNNNNNNNDNGNSNNNMNSSKINSANNRNNQFHTQVNLYFIIFVFLSFKYIFIVHKLFIIPKEKVKLNY
jgi:hypothetical protein